MMLEILSKTDDPNVPLRDQEFYELMLDDSDDIWHPGFVVKQAHAQWSEIDRTIMWDEFESERALTLADAQKRYETRRVALIAKGFKCSDMELL